MVPGERTYVPSYLAGSPLRTWSLYSQGKSRGVPKQRGLNTDLYMRRTFKSAPAPYTTIYSRFECWLTLF